MNESPGSRLLDVLVHGAGPAGLVTALALAQRGLAVAIAVRGPGPSLVPALRPMALVLTSLGPAAVAALSRLGLHGPLPGIRPAAGRRHALSREPLPVAPPGGLAGALVHPRRLIEELALVAARLGVVPIVAPSGLAPVWEPERGCWHPSPEATAQRRTLPGRWGLERSRPRRPARGRPDPGRPEARERAPEWSARYLVDATGAVAALGRTLGSRQVCLDHQVAVMVPARGSTHAIPASRLVEAAKLGWWYCRQGAWGGPLPTLLTDLELLPVTNSALRQRIATSWSSIVHVSRGVGPLDLGRLLIAPAGTSYLEPGHGPGWLAVGDAALCLDGLSGDGLDGAVLAGIDAARAVAATLAGDAGAAAAHAATIRARLGRHLERRAAIHDAPSEWPAAPFWQRRAGGRPAGARRRG